VVADDERGVSDTTTVRAFGLSSGTGNDVDVMRDAHSGRCGVCGQGARVQREQQDGGDGGREHERFLQCSMQREGPAAACEQRGL
jgi:hypothetical protein